MRPGLPLAPPLRSGKLPGLCRPTQLGGPTGQRLWPSSGEGRRSSTEAPRRVRAAQVDIAAEAEVDNSPDLPAASWSVESIALQKWSLRGAWGMCPDCNILQARPLNSASFARNEHAANLRPSDCKICKRGSRKHCVPQPGDVPEPLQGLSEARRSPAPVGLQPWPGKSRGLRLPEARPHDPVLLGDQDTKAENCRAARKGEAARLGRPYGACSTTRPTPTASFTRIMRSSLTCATARRPRLRPSAPCTSSRSWGAVWPSLYWTTTMCETHERYTDHRRLEREHGEEDLEDVEASGTASSAASAQSC